MHTPINIHSTATRSLCSVRTCLHTLVSALLVIASGNATAGPEGAQVVGGAGNISQSGLNTTINQSTQNMAINWQSYNVNVDERVQYIQPNSSSLSLNRILSNNGSTIAGRIDANGQVILVNPNGVFFTPTASINVGGIIASTLDMTPTDFMNGNYIFNEVLGADGAVVNSGMINASLGGNVALIGKQVENDGLIVATLGTVNLAAGKQAVLTFDQGGLLGVRVSKEILQEELGVDPAVMNSGDIQAQGGRVLLTASVSQDVFSQAVNTNGMEQATSVVVHDDGSFTLGGGADVVNTGSIDTSTTSGDQSAGRIVLLGENVTSSGELRADAANGNGGEIELHAQDKTLLTEDSVTTARSERNGSGGIVKVLGDKVGLFDLATVDVSGANGGGQALIGGDQEGSNPSIRNANFIYLAEQSQALADSIENGNGGKIITFAKDTARIYGKLFARGGVNGGNGGFIETSGLNGFQIVGAPDVSARSGIAGIWLIDPYNLTINNNDTQNILVDNNTFTSTGTPAEVDVDDVRDALDNGSTVIARTGNGGTGNGDITFNAVLSYNNRESGTLILDAAGDITFEAGSRISDSAPDNNNLQDRLNVVLLAGGAVTLDGASGNEAAALITTQGGNFTVGTAANRVTSFTNNGTLSTAGINGCATVGCVDGGNVSIYTAGNISTNGFTTAGRADDSGSIIYGGGGGSVVLNTSGSASTITVNGSITTSGGSDNDGDRVGGNAGSVSLTAIGGISLGGNITASGGASTGTAGNGAAVILSGPVTLTADNIAIDASGDTRGDICFTNSCTEPTTASTLNGNGVNAGNLALTANNVLFNGVVGGTIEVGNLSINATGAVNAGANNISANSFSVAQSTSFTSSTVDTSNAGGTGGDISITSEQIVLNDDLNASGTTSGSVDLILSAAGSVTLNRTTDFTSAVTLTGSAGNDTLNAANRANNWQIQDNDAGGATSNGVNDGTLNTNLRFENIENLNGNDGSDDFTVNTLATIASINGGGGTGTNTLTGRSDAPSLWIVNTANGGSVADNTDTANPINYVTNFSNIQTLTGGTNADSFVMTSTSSIGTINGGTGGGNSLTGRDTATLWTISVANSGSVADNTNPASLVNYVTAFNNLQTLNGGTNVDTFAVAANFNGVMNGGANADVFNITSSNTGSLNGQAGSDVFNINAAGLTIADIQGGLGNDTLVAANEANYWAIDAAGNSAIYANDSDRSAPTSSRATFSGIEAITGGDNIDDINLVNPNALIGLLDGGAGGSDILSITTDGVTVQLGDRTLADAVVDTNLNVNGVETITATVGTPTNGIDTLIGDNSANTWTIGTTTSVAGVTFTNFDVLTGGTAADGSAVDTFNINANFAGTINGGQAADTSGDIFNFQTGLSNGTFTGTVNGGGGNDVFNIQDTNITFSNSLNGGSGGNDTLTAANEANYWTVSGIDTGQIYSANTRAVAEQRLGYDSMEILVGNAGIDEFLIGATGNVSQEIRGGTDTNNTLIARDGANEWNISGVNAGELHVDNGGTAFDIAYVASFTGIQNVTGGSGTDRFVIGATGSLAGTLNGAGGANTLIGRNAANEWDINAANGGSLYIDNSATGFGTAYVNTFSNIQALMGGTAGDRFVMDLSGSVTTIDGVSAANNTLVARQGVQNTWSFTGAESGSLAQTTPFELYVGSFSNIQAFVGGGGGNEWADLSALASANVENYFGFTGIIGNGLTTLNGQDGQSNDWSIENIALATPPPSGTMDGINDGTFSNANGSLTFVDFANLVGGDNSDTFTIVGTANVGSIDGGVLGGTNEIVGPTGGPVTWTLGDTIVNTSVNYDISSVGFTNIDTLTGAINTNDTYNFSVDPAGSGVTTINGNGGSGNDTVSVASVVAGAILNVGTYQGIEEYTGNANSTLEGGAGNTWTIENIGGTTPGVNDGTVNVSTNFYDFGTVRGGTGIDTFTYIGAATIGMIDGGAGAGVNEIQGPIGSNTWTIAAATRNVNGNNFTNIQTLTGGSGVDTFLISTNSATSGVQTMNGGAGNDVFVFNSLLPTSANIAIAGQADIDTVDLSSAGTTIAYTFGQYTVERIIGNNTDSTITAVAGTNDWSIQPVAVTAGQPALTEGENDGTITNAGIQQTFIDFNNLTGGDNIDNYRFEASGTLTGQVNGMGNAGGNNTLTIVNTNISISSVELGVRTSSSLNVANVQDLTGNGTATLISDSAVATNNWAMTSPTGGTINTATLFSNFAVLQGSTSDDVFTLHDTATFNGSISGGAGAGTDQLIGGNRAGVTIWSFEDDAIVTTQDSGRVSGVTGFFSDFERLEGGTGQDSFLLHSTLNYSGDIDGGAGPGLNSLTGGGRTNSWTINSANGGTVTGLGGTFANIQNINGGTDALTGNDQFDDTFTFEINGRIDGGRIDGRGHVGTPGDIVDISGINNANVMVSYRPGTTSATDVVVNVTNVEQVTGNNDGTGAFNSTLIGEDNSNTWSINGTNSGTIDTDSVTFIDFNILQGGSGADTFNVAMGGDITGLINGGGPTRTPWDPSQPAPPAVQEGTTQTEDVLNLSALNLVDVVIGTDFTNIELVRGNVDGTGPENSTLRTGATGDNNWLIQGAGQGVVNNTQFVQFNNIVGGTGDDTFVVQGSFGGNIRGGGGAGIDTVNYEALGSNPYRVEFGGPLGVDEIERVEGDGTDFTIVGRAGFDNTWRITGNNSGEVTANGETLAFIGFDNVEGNDQAAFTDMFNIRGGSLDGAITGMAGDDTLDVQLNGTEVGQIYFDGGADSNTVLIQDGAATAPYTVVYTSGMSGGYDQLQYTNIVGTPRVYSVNYQQTGMIQDSLSADLLTVNGTANTDTIQLGFHAGSGMNTFTLVGSQTVNYSNKDNLTIMGLGGVNDTVDVTSDPVLTSTVVTDGVLTINAEQLTAAATITANRLVLDSVVNAGVSPAAPIDINVDELSILDSAGVAAQSVYLREQNALGLTGLGNVESVNLNVLAGDVTNSVALISNSQLDITSGGDILLTGNNQLSGALLFNATAVNINNTISTNLGGVTATNLTLVSTGDITDSGAMNVNAGTTMLTSGGNILLDNAANDFGTVSVLGANDASINDMNALTITGTNVNGTFVATSTDMAVGDIMAGTLISLNAGTGAITDQSSSLRAPEIQLRAAQGIGNGAVNFNETNNTFAPTYAGAINTNTTTLSAINYNADPSLSNVISLNNTNNTGGLMVQDLRNNGDILLQHTGDLVFQVGSANVGAANGAENIYVGAIDAHYGSNMNDPVYTGSVVLSGVTGTDSVYTVGVAQLGVDIIAENLYVENVVEFGTNRPDAQYPNPIRLRVHNQFTYISGASASGVVRYPYGAPAGVFSTSDLLEFIGVASFVPQLIIDLETLGEVDQAIFTEVRNYNYDEIAIKLPIDQRYTDEEDEEKKKSRISVE